MEKYKLIVAPSNMAMAEYLSGMITGSLDELSGKAHLNIAVSGGATPEGIFRKLSDMKRGVINWNKVRLFWVDERCVPPDDQESNYRMVKKSLIENINMPGKNIFRIRGEAEPTAEADRYATLLSKELPLLNNIPRFDLVILGLGTDGHTASIFPHNISLFSSVANCAVSTHPVSGQKRITITGRVINNAADVVFLVKGQEKADIVRVLISGDDYSEYPASLVKPVNGDLTWLTDINAVSLIKGYA
ncbi:MAG: 6-phosphogluconolactonase [Bacteroidales bacterium]|nr:6-phosphogluconolactonase [Bacteroidales bacterium]